ncbi:MarR family winged helix-turn-helix transcriptional regulator [Caulobacter sp. RL271]|uniref:MarR family transcriptional regulator n=1 Tax=Caulobacter segnis TaxID=88688 RepID=A0ABY4ZQ97_9CAUL|nr:MarR family transcriptional regulator [Caulobacter segnis]USQ94146.1 MarR family transcriptional regulator [Caulobacter segnis]
MPLDIDDLNRLLFQTEQARRLLVGDRLSRHGIVFGQWLVLDALYKEGLSSMTGLAAAIGADRTTLTRTIDGLVASGHVDRRTPAEDRRLVVVDLTPLGKALVDAVLISLAPVHDSVFAGFSRQDLDTLSLLLARSLTQIRLAAVEGQRPKTIVRLERGALRANEVKGRPRPRP